MALTPHSWDQATAAPSPTPWTPGHISDPSLLRPWCHCPEPLSPGARSWLGTVTAGASPWLQGCGSELSLTRTSCHCTQPRPRGPTHALRDQPGVMLLLACDSPWARVEAWTHHPRALLPLHPDPPGPKPPLYLVIPEPVLLLQLGAPSPHQNLHSEPLMPRYWFHRVSAHTHTVDTSATATGNAPVLQDPCRIHALWQFCVSQILGP